MQRGEANRLPTAVIGPASWAEDRKWSPSSLIFGGWQRLRRRGDVLPWAALTGLLALGAALRFYRLTDLFVFLPDQGQDALITWTMIKTQVPALIGIKSSIGIYHGPAYNYLLLLPFLIGGGHPVSGAALSGALDLLALILLFLIGRRIFSIWVGLSAAALWCSATLILYFARIASDYCPLSFFILLLIYCLLEIIDGHERWLLPFAPLLAIAWQLHDQVALLAPFFVLVWLWFRPRIRIQTYALATVLGLLTLAPYLVYEVQHQFFNFKSIVRYATQSRGTNDGQGRLGLALERVRETLHVLDTRLLPSGTPWHQLAAGLLLIGLVGVVLALRGARRKEGQLFLLWLLTPLAYAIWPGGIEPHYLVVLLPLPFLLAGLGLDTIRRIHWLPGSLLAVVIGWVVITNAQAAFTQQRWSLPGSYPATSAVVDHIITAAQGQPFNFRLTWKLDQNDAFDSSFRYLFLLRGHVPQERSDIPTFFVYQPPDRGAGATQTGIIIGDTKIVRVDSPQLGANILHNGTFTGDASAIDAVWQQSSGSTRRIEPYADGKALVLTGTTTTPPSDVIVTQELRLEAGKRYLVRYRYRSSGDPSAQRVFLQAVDVAGKTIDYFPQGGYVPGLSSTWHIGSFTADIPSTATRTTLWLRLLGRGEVWFTDIEVRELLPATTSTKPLVRPQVADAKGVPGRALALPYEWGKMHIRPSRLLPWPSASLRQRQPLPGGMRAFRQGAIRS